MATDIASVIRNSVDGYIATASDIKGGYVSVATIAERDAIPTPIIIVGSLVYVAETNKDYRWNGTEWLEEIIPSTVEITNAVKNANDAAILSNNYSTLSANSATEAKNAATSAELINAKTMEYVNNKFWWGTLEDYNALPSIDNGTFYFITTATDTSETP